MKIRVAGNRATGRRVHPTGRLSAAERIAGTVNDPCDFLICRALAERLSLHPSAIRADLRLEDDLGVDPLDVALIVLDVTDELRKVMSFESLADVRTVGELVALVRRSPSEDDPFEDEPRGTRTRRRNAHYA